MSTIVVLVIMVGCLVFIASSLTSIANTLWNILQELKKKYKEALERMKSWARGEHPECFTEAQKAAEFIFPELKEDDEKIKKELCKAIWTYVPTEEGQKYIAWIEKQSEQNEWSKEDDMIVLSIKQIVACASLLNLVPERLDRIDKWLKSLKQRIEKWN